MGEENKERVKLTGYCPNCYSKVEYYEGDKTVACPACEHIHSVNDIKHSVGNTQRPSSISASESRGLAIMQSHDTPEAALYYLNDYFKRSVNWDTFIAGDKLYLPHIMQMVEKKREGHANSPFFWLLDFTARIVPLNKRIDSLKDLEDKMFEVYDGKDYTKALNVFYTYSYINNALLENKADIFDNLEQDIAASKELKLDGGKINDMEKQLAEFRKKFDENIHFCDKISDEPVIKRAQDEYNKKIAAKLLESGIIADVSYSQGVDFYNNGYYAAAAAIFSKIRGYSDSLEYLRKLEQDFLFDDAILHIGAFDYFVMEMKPKKDETFNVKNPQNDPRTADDPQQQANAEAQQQLQDALDPEAAKLRKLKKYKLCLINSEKVAEKDTPVVENITQIITTFAGKLLFIQNHRDLCVFDSASNNVKVLVKGKGGDFSVDVSGKKKKSNTFYFNKDHTGIFFRKKLEVGKAAKADNASVKSGGGCGKKKVTVIEKAPEKNYNNFSLLYLDLSTFDIEELAHEMVDIVEFKDTSAGTYQDTLRGVIAAYGDVIFYISAQEVPDEDSDDPKKTKIEETLHVYSLADRSNIGILGSDCNVESVSEDKVIYSQWTPNDWNKDLWVFDIKTLQKTLIETNVYDFEFATPNKVLYRVGNDNYNVLYSNNYEGTERSSFPDIGLIVLYQSGWLYALDGNDLYKISEDGKQGIKVCSNFEQLVESNPTTLYYMDTADRLHVCKVDGTGNRIICSNVPWYDIYVDKDYIHLIRKEDTGPKTENYSLYKIDLNGDNLRKIQFNIVDAVDFDENYIYLLEKHPQKYEFTSYDEKGNPSKSIVDYMLILYRKYNKATGSFELVMRSDPLKGKDVEVRSGCFGRKKKVFSPTYKLIKQPVKIRRSNVASSGAVLEEKEQEANQIERAKEALRQQAAQRKSNGCGCGAKPKK